jgi:hypothetical protein
VFLVEAGLDSSPGRGSFGDLASRSVRRCCRMSSKEALESARVWPRVDCLLAGYRSASDVPVGRCGFDRIKLTLQAWLGQDALRPDAILAGSLPATDTSPTRRVASSIFITAAGRVQRWGCAIMSSASMRRHPSGRGDANIRPYRSARVSDLMYGSGTLDLLQARVIGARPLLSGRDWRSL